MSNNITTTNMILFTIYQMDAIYLFYLIVLLFYYIVFFYIFIFNNLLRLTFPFEINKIHFDWNNLKEDLMHPLIVGQQKHIWVDLFIPLCLYTHN